MQLTKLSSQVKNPDRINVFLDNTYMFSLDISQIIELGVKVGNVYSNEEVEQLKREGEFSKYYMKALVYSLTRPHSIREVKDYLYRQTRTRVSIVKGEKRERKGMPPEISSRIINKLLEKGYLDDQKFTTYWVENRNVKKGISQRTLRQELIKKGVSAQIIDVAFDLSPRDEKMDLKKVIEKRQRHYSDNDKFIKYLINKGYPYSLIQEVLSELSEEVAS